MAPIAETMNEIHHSHESQHAARTAGKYDQPVITGFKIVMIRYRIYLHILFLAIVNYRSLYKAIKASKELLELRNEVYGGQDQKVIHLDKKYYFDIYAPAFPSRQLPFQGGAKT